MKVTLIRPPAYSIGLMGAQLVPFLGIAYIAAVSRKAGHDVDIIDMCGEDIAHTEIVRDKFVAYGMPLRALKSRIKYSDVIGITSTFSQDWVFHRELINYIRGFFPKTVIVAGGEHVTALPEYCLKDCSGLDVCVVGEGEEVFVKLLEVLGRKGDLKVVPSLVYRLSKDGNVLLSTPRASRIKDIDKLPLPAWDLMPIENYLSREMNYHIKRGRTLPMLASRGCPHRCTFCSNANMWGSRWIARNPKLVADEMEYYVNFYKSDNFVFSDLTAVVDKKIIIDLCKEIMNRKINITWQLPTLRTEAVDYEVLKLMRQAGCRDLDFAIESGSNEVLKSVNKTNSPQKMAFLIKQGLALGINFSTNIILGLPKEGFRDFLKSYWLIMKLAVNGLQEINVFPFVPYPGSKLFEEFLSNKKIKLRDDYFFGLSGYTDLSQAISWSDRFGPKTLNFMRLFLFINFYSLMLISHPKRFLLLIKNSLSGKITTKLEGVLQKVFRNFNAYFNKNNFGKDVENYKKNKRDLMRELKKKANWVRQRVLEMITTAGKGHIGGAFSCADILVALYYGDILRFKATEPKYEDRDRFILSKGHSAAALYVILSDLGYFSPDELNHFQKENCILGAHPNLKIPGIEADTGSLGHGLGIGAGLALNAKLSNKNSLTFVLLGDGECCEGSVWEAAMFASRQKLNNLVAIIDKNGLCSTDFLKNCVEMEPLEQKWRTFGWDAITIDGHSFEELISVFSQARFRKSERPLMIVANTIKGKGVSFMEGKPEWHHSVPNKEQFEIAKKELSDFS